MTDAAKRPKDSSAPFTWALVLRLARARALLHDEPAPATFLEQRTRYADAVFVLAALGLRVASRLNIPARFLYSTPGLCCVLLERPPGADEIDDAQRLVATEYAMLGDICIASAVLPAGKIATAWITVHDAVANFPAREHVPAPGANTLRGCARLLGRDPVFAGLRAQLGQQVSAGSGAWLLTAAISDVAAVAASAGWRAGWLRCDAQGYRHLVTLGVPDAERLSERIAAVDSWFTADARQIFARVSDTLHPSEQVELLHSLADDIICVGPVGRLEHLRELLGRDFARLGGSLRGTVTEIRAGDSALRLSQDSARSLRGQAGSGV